MPFVWVCDYWLKNAHGIPIGGCNLNENKLFKYFSSNNLTWQHSTELYMAHEAFGMKERNMAGNTAQSSSVSVCVFKELPPPYFFREKRERERETERERERERDTQRERDRERDTERGRESGREEREKEREIEREERETKRKRERERDRDRERETQREREREGERETKRERMERRGSGADFSPGGRKSCINVA